MRVGVLGRALGGLGTTRGALGLGAGVTGRTWGALGRTGAGVGRGAGALGRDWGTGALLRTGVALGRDCTLGRLEAGVALGRLGAGVALGRDWGAGLAPRETPSRWAAAAAPPEASSVPRSRRRACRWRRDMSNLRGRSGRRRGVAVA